MLSFISTLLTLALAFGLQHTVDAIDRVKAKNAQVTPDDVIRATSTLISEAKTKGSKVVEAISRKLNAVDIPFQAGSEVKSYIMNVRRNLNEKLDKANDIAKDVEQKLNTQQERVNNYQYQNDFYRTQNKATLNDIVSKVKEQRDRMNQVEQSLK